MRGGVRHRRQSAAGTARSWRGHADEFGQHGYAVREELGDRRLANPDWQRDSAARPATDQKQIAALQYRNQGSSMVAVVERLRAEVPDLLADVTFRD